MQKFENIDVIAALEAIMHQNTAYYQSDFAYDIKMMREAARSDKPEDKLLLWLSRPSGTFCFRERDVLLKDTQAYNTWKSCGLCHEEWFLLFQSDEFCAFHALDQNTEQIMW